MDSIILAEMQDNINNLLGSSDINADEVLKYVALTHNSSVFSDENADISRILKNIAEKIKGKKVGVFPASSFLEELLNYTKDQDIKIYDDFRKGEIVGKTEISSPDSINSDDCEYIVFISFRPNLLEILKGKTDKNIITLQSALEEYVKGEMPVDDLLRSDESETGRVEDILKEIELSENPVIFLNGFLFNNYGPTFEAVEKTGRDVFVLAANEHLLYAKPDSKIYEFPVKNVFHLSVAEIINFALKINKGTVFINDISFLLPGFNAYKGILSLSFATALMNLIKTKKVLFLYDIVPSFIEGYEYESTFTNVYKNMLEAADGIILNSNTKEGSDTLRNMFDVDKPYLSFYRYSSYADKLQDKIKDGFHLAIIGGMDDKLRDSRHMLIKLIRKGIYIHNYVPCKAMLEFEQALTEEEKNYYTLHESIVDQGELVYEISKYHAGWIIDNGFELVNLINSVSETKLKELFMMFRLSTISSSLIVHCSAGLPVFINRMVVHVRNEFPSEFFIPAEEAEMENFENIKNRVDWEKTYDITQENRKMFSIDYNIKRLTNFIEMIEKDYK